MTGYVTGSSRVLCASEAYYQLLERLWPVNAHLVLELAADAATVAAAWAETVRRMPMLGAYVVRTERGTELVFGGPGLPEPCGSYATAEEALGVLASDPMDLSRFVARCALVEGDGVTTAVVSIHHSVIDGRGLFQVATVIGALVAGEEPPDMPLLRETVGLETLLADRDPKARRRELLALARQVRAEEGYVENADPIDWHDPRPGEPREVASALFEVDAECTARLLANARAAGATVHGLLVAATLHACAELSPGAKRLALSSAVDLRVACGVPVDAPVAQAAAIMGASYDVTLPNIELAREVSADTRRRVDRGEAELMLALSGAERMPIGPESDDVVRRWSTAVRPSVQISNLGVFPGPVPATIRAFYAALAPTPSQAAFVAVTTTNGKMGVAVGYDRNRISVDGRRLAADIEARIRALADEDLAPGR